MMGAKRFMQAKERAAATARPVFSQICSNACPGVPSTRTRSAAGVDVAVAAAAAAMAINNRAASIDIDNDPTMVGRPLQKGAVLVTQTLPEKSKMQR